MAATTTVAPRPSSAAPTSEREAGPEPEPELRPLQKLLGVSRRADPGLTPYPTSFFS